MKWVETKDETIRIDEEEDGLFKILIIDFLEKILTKFFTWWYKR